MAEEVKVTVKKLYDKTWMFDEGGVRFFLLEGEDAALMIDCGMMTQNAKELAEEITSLPISLIITHSDRDHIGSVDEFDEVMMNPAEAVNFYKNNGKTQQMIPVWDNDELDLGGRTVSIVTLPGHTSGSIAIVDVDAKCAFTGDPIQDGNIFMFGNQREMHAYIASLEKFYMLQDMVETIYPSHASETVSFDLIPVLKQGAEDLLAGKLTGEKINMFGTEVMKYDVGGACFLYDL